MKPNTPPPVVRRDLADPRSTGSISTKSPRAYLADRRSSR
jgi:hypothetical protein